MVKKELFDEALSFVEKVYNLSKIRYEETQSDRFVILNELTRKIRTSFNAIHFIPFEQYEVLYPSVNLLFRSVIIDLMTSLLLLLIKDEQLEDFLLIDNLKFIDSLKSALEAEVEIRKHLDPQNINEYEKLKKEYQINLYDDLQDCLKSEELWDKKQPNKVIINGISYRGQVKDIYEILKSSEELYVYAYLYKYYRLFSQSEHFSMKGRVVNYKQTWHDDYYNKILGFIYLGEQLIYSKYTN